MKKILISILAFIPQVVCAAHKIEMPSVIKDSDAVIDPGKEEPAKAVLDYVLALGNNLLLFVAGLAVLGITIAGVQMLIHMGGEDGLTQAKKTITYSLAGLVIALLAWVIINTVVSAIIMFVSP